MTTIYSHTARSGRVDGVRRPCYPSVWYFRFWQIVMTCLATNQKNSETRLTAYLFGGFMNIKGTDEQKLQDSGHARGEKALSPMARRARGLTAAFAIAGSLGPLSEIVKVASTGGKMRSRSGVLSEILDLITQSETADAMGQPCHAKHSKGGGSFSKSCNRTEDYVT